MINNKNKSSAVIQMTKFVTVQIRIVKQLYIWNKKEKRIQKRKKTCLLKTQIWWMRWQGEDFHLTPVEGVLRTINQSRHTQGVMFITVDIYYCLQRITMKNRKCLCIYSIYCLVPVLNIMCTCEYWNLAKKINIQHVFITPV